MDLRKRVLAMCDAGRTTREVARVLDVSEAWVRRLKQRRREEGIVGPRPSGGRRHGHFDPLHLEQLRAWLCQHHDATLEWLLRRVEREMGLRCNVMAVCRAVKKLAWSLKKNASSRRTGSPGCRPPTHELRHRASLHRPRSVRFPR